MFRHLVLILASVFIARGDESCDRKEMEDTICSLCAQRKGNNLVGTGNKQIAFFAYMSKNMRTNTFSKHKIFVYDRTEINIGNGYDVKSGKFTAPVSGVYIFHTSTVAYDRSHCIVEVVQNGVVKDIGWADAMHHSDRASASTMTILQLKKGDIVNSRVGAYHGGNYLESNAVNRMSFSGFRLA